MGIFEDKIKADLLQGIYADSIAIYELIESRFLLSEESRDEVIKKINNLNEELVSILKDVKLS